MDNWPVLLQQKLETAFQMTYGNSRIATEMDIGPAKVRSRFTDTVDIYTCQITMDMDEKAIFDQFFKTTLGNGTLPFLFVDPFSQVEEVFRFAPDQSPVLTPLGGRVFTLRMTWEKLP